MGWTGLVWMGRSKGNLELNEDGKAPLFICFQLQLFWTPR
jgi:hypothetical protein